MPLNTELANRIYKSIKIDAEKDCHFGTITYLHDKAHNGKMLYVSEVRTVLNDGEIYIHSVAGANKYLHVQLDISSIGLWEFSSYAGTTYTSPGTLLSQINRLSDSTYSPEVLFYENLVGDIDVLGTLRLNYAFGGGTNPSQSTTGSLSERIESIFQPNLDIMVKLTNRSGATQTLSLTYNYYEEE